MKNKKVGNAEVFISKTGNSYVIGPKVNQNFDEETFYKRMLSSSVYDKSNYKRCFKKTAFKLIDNYYNSLKSNEVIEIFKDGRIIKHKIILLPRGNYEKE